MVLYYIMHSCVLCLVLLFACTVCRYVACVLCLIGIYRKKMYTKTKVTEPHLCNSFQYNIHGNLLYNLEY